MKVVKIVRNINHGGFGVIDEVLCDDGYHYARKTFSLSEELKKNPKLCDTLKSRFVREVKTQKILPDDYFMPILFEDLNAPSPYFIMPIAEDVFTEEIERCKSESRHPEGLGDILNSLEFLHEKALVHRDLKPQNILKHNGIWKLADFGLISQDKEILSETITTSNQAFGTVMYCAPEQVVEFGRITPQADIYSFGAILHDIFTDGTRVPYSALTADGDVGQIIEKCTKHKKEHRFRSIKSLRSKLLTILSNDSGSKFSVSDLEWAEAFNNHENWDIDTFESFVFYTRKSETFPNYIFRELNEESIESLYILDENLFYELALCFLDWVFFQSFSFDYCDVVISTVYHIYELSGDIEVKSKCAIAAAELGKSHNRWYVMGYVVRMCGTEIDSNLAFRIGMDIELDERNKINFLACADRIHKPTSAYHSEIQKALL